MFYVTMTDQFFTGWGHAIGKTDKLVISCADMGEAMIVEKNALRRHEMKHVNITSRKPSYPKSVYKTDYHGREQGDYESWFTDHPEWN